MTLLDLFFTFFKIGAFTFGGGYAMLPFVQQEVLAHRWMSLDELVDFIAVSESTPGPFAINTATFVGSRVAGFTGAVLATLGVIMPSFLIILAIARAYEKFRENAAVKSVMSGLKPAVVGLIGAAVLTVAASVFGIGEGASAGAAAMPASRRIISAAIFVLSTFLIVKKKAHPIFVILLAAAAGIACGYAGLL